MKILQTKNIKHLHIYQHSISTESVQLKDRAVYMGIDLTAPFIHLGHLSLFNLLLNLESYGAKLIILLGDFTTNIGDPAFRTKSRVAISRTNIEKNMISIRSIIRSIFDAFNIDIEFVHNAEFYKNFLLSDYIEFASRINLSTLLSSDMFRENYRILKLSELLYSTIQGYDFYTLYTKYRCIAQVGGQDQWLNMLIGQHTIEKSINILDDDKPFVMTLPLIVDAQGKKIGKSVLKSGISLDLSTLPQLYSDIFSLHDTVVTQVLSSIDRIISTISTKINTDIDASSHVASRMKLVLVIAYLVGRERAVETVRYIHARINNLNCQSTHNIYTIEAYDNIFDTIAQFSSYTRTEIKKLISSGAVLINSSSISHHTEYLSKLSTTDINLIQVGKIIRLSRYRRTK